MLNRIPLARRLVIGPRPSSGGPSSYPNLTDAAFIPLELSKNNHGMTNSNGDAVSVQQIPSGKFPKCHFLEFKVANPALIPLIMLQTTTDISSTHDDMQRFKKASHLFFDNGHSPTIRPKSGWRDYIPVKIAPQGARNACQSSFPYSCCQGQLQVG